MLADEGENVGHAGSLSLGTHRPSEWLSSLIGFISAALPGWRDDPRRERVTNETRLTAQLCAKLNGLCRHSLGWDILQFRREEPDEVAGARALDLVAAPNGQVIFIAGREYDEYQFLLPIECKRLPTPDDRRRDEREYLISRLGTVGGVHRFKAGYHGSKHERAAMIGYVQTRDIGYWHRQVDAWIDGIVAQRLVGWSVNDKLHLVKADSEKRTAELTSNHERQGDLGPIHIDHLWVEM